MVFASSCLERKRSEMKTSCSTGSLEKEESELQAVNGRPPRVALRRSSQASSRHCCLSESLVFPELACVLSAPWRV